MLREVNTRFMPNKVAVGMPNPADPTLKDSPLLEQRVMQDGQPTAYVCENYACQLPVTDAQALAAQLDRP